MRYGVIFPQTEIGPDPGGVRAFAEAAEGLGYDHLVVYDHVLGADISGRPDWPGPYTHKSLFHEPFVLFGYLAAVTQRLELVTGILILAQRQTALVAKQAAEVDVLSGGRLRLGIGIGWNEVEYEALGENFHNRGKRSEEQVEVLRALWSQEVVTYEGKWHRIPAAGINPLPMQRPIPIWFGGGRTEAVVRRIARLADGWFPQRQPDQQGQEALEQLRQFAREEGRDPASIGIETRVRASDGIETALGQVKEWQRMGATHLGINTMGAGFRTVDEHISAIRAFKEGLG
jgi:probable F420-dependent oxidoreductase